MKLAPYRPMRLALDLARSCVRLLRLSASTKNRINVAARSWLGPVIAPSKLLANSAACVRVHNGGRAIGYVAASKSTPSKCTSVRTVAFYLPQFHPIAENDLWWGPGFTEWSNVARAAPQFDGHAQPQLPADLGFYDLRVPAVMQHQVNLAKHYGIGAFCFYFYWFGGQRLLEAPLETYLSDASLDLPFCLCWANEPWTRRWDGREDDVLMPQRHGPEDDLAFIAHISRYLSDPRYLRVTGSPVILIYRVELMPDPPATAQRWREYCRASGLGEIHLVCVQSFAHIDPLLLGFDAAVEFPPNLVRAKPINDRLHFLNPNYSGEVLDWSEMAEQFRCRDVPHYPLYRGVNPSWDNEARRPGTGRSFLGASPRRYEDWLRWAAADTEMREPRDDHRLVFINAWNEWAEGAHLEPDVRLGHAWLAATQRALQPCVEAPDRPCVVAHVYYLEFLDELLQILDAAEFSHRLVLTVPPEHEVAVIETLAARQVLADVVVNENRGRDVLPFLKICDQLLNEGEDLVLKLHSKRSLHMAGGDDWRAELLTSLLSRHAVSRTLASFASRPRLGIVGPSQHWVSTVEHMGGNAFNLERLVSRLGMAPTLILDTGFFAGTMFWLRLQALRPLVDEHLGEWEFDIEQGQVDGTLAHAIERIFCSVAVHAGYEVATIEAPDDAPPEPMRDYPFVPRHLPRAADQVQTQMDSR